SATRNPQSKNKRLKMSKYAFLRSNASLAIIGLILGLVGGFKIANSQYRSERRKVLEQDIDRATSGMSSSQAEINAIIEKAKADPNDVEAQIEAALQFIQSERPQEAMPFLERARAADPNDKRLNAGFGYAYFVMGQYDQAIDSLKRSQEQGVNNPIITTLLIGSYIQTRKNLDEAERLFKELETQKVNPAQLAQIRADLDTARSGKTENPGATPSEKTNEAQKPRTVLSHGPEEPKSVK
ncbi:MAG: tetratricopeptide repeat protein, partial [Blastocatellia bacterium]